MTPQPREFDDIIVLEANARDCVPRPWTEAEREKYLEMLKKHVPHEYAEIMKRRELRAKKDNDKNRGESR